MPQRNCPEHGPMAARSGRADSWYCKPCKNAGSRSREASKRSEFAEFANRVGSPATSAMAASDIATEMPSLPAGASRTPPPQAEGYWVAEDSPDSLVILPDIHFPYEDPNAVSAVLEFISDVKPQKAVQIGDALDFYGISVYPKTPGRVGAGHRLIDEVRSARPFWDQLERDCGEVEFLPGNHEERLYRNVIGQYHALDGLPGLELRNVLDLPESIKCHGFGVKLRIGNLTLTHGDKIRRGRFVPKYAAASVLAKYPNMNLVAGHTHIIDVARQVVHYHDGPHQYVMRYIGWLGDAAQIEYESDPSYQQGFAYVEFWKAGDKVRHTFNQIEIVNGQFKYGGKVYGKRRRAA